MGKINRLATPPKESDAGNNLVEPDVKTQKQKAESKIQFNTSVPRSLNNEFRKTAFDEKLKLWQLLELSYASYQKLSKEGRGALRKKLGF